LPAQRVELVHPGHDAGRFAAIPTGAGEAVRAVLGLAPTAPVIALIGRVVTAQKGQDLMIRAMPELLRHCPDASLLIVGDGPDRAALETLTGSLGVATAVRFLGWRDDIRGFLAASNVVAVPSVIEEAFGLTALEGMAAGRPVITFASGGLPELVRHGETGFLVPKGDVAGLGSAILRLLTDATLCHALGAAGRRVAATFTTEARVEALTDINERIAASSKRPPQ
jgi:glycosyltransferase involved in cell wall biosynthesis